MTTTNMANRNAGRNSRLSLPPVGFTFRRHHRHATMTVTTAVACILHTSPLIHASISPHTVASILYCFVSSLILVRCYSEKLRVLVTQVRSHINLRTRIQYTSFDLYPLSVCPLPPRGRP